MKVKKIRLAILSEFSKGNNKICSNDLGIDENEFMEALNFLKEEKMINDYEYFMDGTYGFESTRVTLKGEQYLSDNSVLLKTYKGLKEIKEWLPFL